MFVKTLKSLVLRGSVRRDGQAVGARLGFSYLTASQRPEVPVSMRHGESLPVAGPEKRHGREDNPPVDNPALRAGRSDRLAGVLHRRIPTRCVGRTSFPWSPRIPPAETLYLTAFGPSRLHDLARSSGSKQAGRTRPASTKGRDS
jgi:hypothetical protein